MSDTPALKPVTPERLVREIRKLIAERKDGALTASVYDQRLARTIGELRDRGISGGRDELLAALTPLKSDGTLSADDWSHLARRLGLDG
ncbi:MAG TPA: hypothetical protein VGI83_03950 [Gemmatimonadales bacterium]